MVVCLIRQLNLNPWKTPKVNTNLDKYFALDEKKIEEMNHYSTRVSSKHKADLQETQRKLSLKRYVLPALGDLKKNGDVKGSKLCHRSNIFLRFISKWR